MDANRENNKVADNVAENEVDVDDDDLNNENTTSKKALKKEAKRLEKLAKQKEREEALKLQQAQQNAAMEKVAQDIDQDSWGYMRVIQSQTLTKEKRTWTEVESLGDQHVGQHVWVRARVQESRCKGSLGFLVLRHKFYTIQAVLDASCPKEMIKWTSGVPLESIVDIYAKVTKPAVEIRSTTQKTELQVVKIFGVSKLATELPFQLRDANQPDLKDGETPSEGVILVGQDVRLDNRVLDLRTYPNQAIFRVQSAVSTLFRETLLKDGFIEIHTPKLIGGASEGGANVFKLEYFGSPACLAQSPQLHKQMALCADLDRVFEIGPVFRAENSNTHRHLCEFTGLDLEMAVKEDYNEILDVVDKLFQSIFAGLQERCAAEIETIRANHPSEPFQWISKAPRIPFAEGIAMLREAKCPGVPDDISAFDLSTEQEKLLGALVKQKYNTDFYMLVKYPLKVRPFYTMPAPEDPTLSNSYDMFMRGEEIVSGAQRVHDPNMLVKRAEECGVPVKTIQAYVDAFKLGAYPHGGVGIGLERVVMLFLGLHNIRKTSLFPRDPKRLSP